MKLVNYKCDNCGFEKEYLYQDSEWKICDDLEETECLDECPYCGGNLIIFNFKNNSQVWKFFDNR